jgi:hypothetical protein
VYLLYFKSICSINDTAFSLSSFAAALPIISLCTCTFVFNINNIVSIFKPTNQSWLIRRFIAIHINEMQNDDEVAWKARGVAFRNLGTFHPRESCPSPWRILEFAVRRLFLKKRTFRPGIGGLVRVLSWRPSRVGGFENGLPNVFYPASLLAADSIICHSTTASSVPTTTATSTSTSTSKPKKSRAARLDCWAKILGLEISCWTIIAIVRLMI